MDAPGIYNAVFFVFACIVLFLYSLKGFSVELQKVGGQRLNDYLSRVTRNRFRAFGLGALITAVIQSSSAVSSMTVALVDAGAIPFASSLAVLLGAGVGTTATVWLVSLNFMGMGVYFMVFGFLIGALPFRFALIGKSLFYFGFILFTLQLLSDALTPLREMPEIIDILSSVDNILIAMLAGLLITAAVQSSTVVIGVTVILVQGGLVPLHDAIGIVVGAKVGSTSTALLASLGMGVTARLSALSNFIFYTTGAVLCIPLSRPLERFARTLTDDAGMQVAYCTLMFSVVVALIFLPFVKAFAGLMMRSRKVVDASIT